MIVNQTAQEALWVMLYALGITLDIELDSILVKYYVSHRCITLYDLFLDIVIKYSIG